MAAAKNPSMFHVVNACELKPERDVFVGLPVETTNKQTFHRVPIRSACTEGPAGDRRVRVQLVDNNPNVVKSCQGLQRLLLKFPSAFVPGIKVFEASNDNDRTNLSMGFALYDYRLGPTPEEQSVLDNIDALALFLRQQMVRCDRIRRTLKLGPDNMTSQQQQVAADMMDLHVARPAVDRSGENRSARAAPDGMQTMPSRYCYVKLVPPDPNVNEIYHTYFWTVDGKRVPFETVVGFRNFHVQAFVEVEDIFVSKAVRSLQLKLRECLVVPPVERMQSRYSVCFPEKVCSKDAPEEEVVPEEQPPRPVKRARVEEETPEEKPPCCEEEEDDDRSATPAVE